MFAPKHIVPATGMFAPKDLFVAISDIGRTRYRSYPPHSEIGYGIACYQLQSEEVDAILKRLSEESRIVSAVAAGIITLCLSLYGCIAVLPFDLERISDVSVAVWLIGPFPIYLLQFWSKRVASIGLWVLFLYAWANRSLNSVPRGLLNPLDWSGGVALLIAAILMTVGAKSAD